MSIQEQIDSVRRSFLAELDSFSDDSGEIDLIRSKYLGRKGQVASLFNLMGNASQEERPVLGQKLNDLKIELTDLYENKINSLTKEKQRSQDQRLDLSLPGREHRLGSLHILEQTLNEVKDIFRSIGFHIEIGRAHV